MRRVTITLSKAALSTLQDQARAAHRPPKAHLEWLIEQSLQLELAQESLQARVERLEQQVGACQVA